MARKSKLRLMMEEKVDTIHNLIMNHEEKIKQLETELQLLTELLTESVNDE